MRVRLLQAATVPAHDNWPEGHWHPAGAEVEIPDKLFDPAFHEALSPIEAVAPKPAPKPVTDYEEEENES